ncbi:MAG: hypothetical protein ACK4IC_05040 [Erythrobacter sp.]
MIKTTLMFASLGALTFALPAAAQERTTTRSDGQVSRSVSRTRAPGVTRPPRARHQRG